MAGGLLGRGCGWRSVREEEVTGGDWMSPYPG